VLHRQGTALHGIGEARRSGAPALLRKAMAEHRGAMRGGAQHWRSSAERWHGVVGRSIAGHGEAQCWQREAPWGDGIA